MNWGGRGGITETRNWLDWSAWERMPEGREERRGDLRTVRERGALEFMEKRGKWGEKKDFGKRYEYKGFRKFCCVLCYMSPCFPGGSEVKASAWNAGIPGSIPGSGRSPGEGNGNLLLYSCLENSMDRGAWRATVHGVTKTWTWLSEWHTETQITNTTTMKSNKNSLIKGHGKHLTIFYTLEIFA